ncbi:hypothetical protein Aple_065290 [Acrocarpospora pleiomorpha]|uniref:FtsH ternary system domain-containing protein n=1 Tax=Acrocarpospora pleiomorpha TaxID=90975 RepID=A0A5M3XS55_9ACTN|nr:hypothetical protein Aple_065290 [Acrocarpospora pleiomorpha]
MRFGAATTALMFAAQLHRSDDLAGMGFLRADNAWWVRVDLSLDVVREAALSCGGRVHVTYAGQLVPDRGWGEPPTEGVGLELSSLTETPLVEAVRIAGLVKTPPTPVSQVTIVVPGLRLAELIRRALDLNLTVTYQRVDLTPLFEAGDGDRAHAPGGGPGRSGYAGTQSHASGGRSGYARGSDRVHPSGGGPRQSAYVRDVDQAHAPSGGSGRSGYVVDLVAGAGSVSPSLVAALERDPFVLVCRRVRDRLLIQHRHASPLPDRVLAALVDHGVWVLAADGYGCARLTAHGEPQPGTAFVRSPVDRPLQPLESLPEWPDAVPEPPTLTVVPARAHGQKIDAVLLSDEGLAALPLVLEGLPLAETAQLTLGRDRHLLTATGGVLEDLPVGEPLRCVGPGQLYLPLGFRLKPRLPPAARRALFPTDQGDAIVLTANACYAFLLRTAVPVWQLWAGEPLEVDVQLPPEMERSLRLIDDGLTPPERTRRVGFLPSLSRPRRSGPRGIRREPMERGSWQDQAWALESDGQLIRAAELHNRHNQPLQAARLYERAAELEEG